MKKVLLSLMALVAFTLVACGPSKEFKTQADFINTQMLKLDSVNTFDALLTFQNDFMQGAQQFDKDDKLTKEENDSLTVLVGHLTEKLQVKTQQLMPMMDTSDVEVVQE